MKLRSWTRREALIGAGFAALPAAGAFGAHQSRLPVVSTVRVPDGGIQPQVTQDRSGSLHIVYYAGDARAGNLFYVSSEDHARTFSRKLQVNSAGSAIAAGTIRGAQLAVDGRGIPHVAWNGSPAANARGPVNPDSGKPGEPMLYSRLTDDRSAFQAEQSVMQKSFGLDGGGSLTADESGNVYVLWHGIGVDEANGSLKGEARRQVWVASSRDSGIHFSPESKAWTRPTGACGCCGLKAFSTRSGEVLAMYRSATEEVHRDIYLLRSTDRGQTFSGRLLHKWDINACPMSSMDFAEVSGNIVAAWETGGQIYWSKVIGDGPYPTEPVAAPGDGKGRKHPRVAFNSKGELLLTWTEGTGWQRGGSLAWQLYSREGKATGAAGVQPGVPVWSFGAPFATRDNDFRILY